VAIIVHKIRSDLCSHGEVYLRIGEYEVLNKDNGDWTVASAALRIMKSALYDNEQFLYIA